MSVFEVTIESLVPGGDGLARRDGKVIFIPDVLPGERVKVRLVQSKRDFERAEVTEIVQASPHRRSPPCPAASRCGGCDWLHMDTAAQARFKVDMAKDAYRRLGGFDFPALEIETGEPWGYRNRLQVHADAQGRLGFMGRHSGALAQVDHCPVAHESLQGLFQTRAHASAPRRFLAFGHATAGKPECHREDSPETPENAALGHTVKVCILGRDFTFPLAGFFQSNLAMFERLIAWSLEGEEGKRALDFYSGVGVFAAFLAERFHHVLALEEQAETSAWIMDNVMGDKAKAVNGQGVDQEGDQRAGRLEIVTGKLEEWANSEKLKAQAHEADLILVDPPRLGLHPEARRFLAEAKAKRLIYVSCDVVTQARDLKDLLRSGYRLEDLKLFDFYPQTHHLEAVAKLAL